MEELRSIIFGTAGLSILAFLALVLTVSRSPLPRRSTEARQVKRIAAVNILMHFVHFIEEWHTGFPVRFPELLGLAPWSSAFFVSFNLFWLAIWIFCTAFLQAQTRIPLFPIWFLALASSVNGVAHPLLSIVAAGYFPGLLSSPLVGVCGLLLLRALASVTSGERISQQTN